jgi:hypothetical protein
MKNKQLIAMLIAQSEAVELTRFHDVGVRFISKNNDELVDVGSKISSLQFSMLNKEEE